MALLPTPPGAPTARLFRIVLSLRVTAVATDVPNVETRHRETPSPLNPMGVKGVGEAGAIPTGALFAQAVEDALADAGLEIREIPLSPNKLFELMSATRKSAGGP